jgi:hypothetical protein
MISNAAVADDGHAHFPPSHAVSHDPFDTNDGPPMHDAARPSHIRSHPIKFGEYGASWGGQPTINPPNGDNTVNGAFSYLVNGHIEIMEV